MTNLDQFIERAPKELAKLLDEARDEIAEAMLQALAESKESETKAVVSVPFTMKLDLSNNGVNYALTVTRKSKWEVVQPFDDPEQEKLPLVDRDGDPISPELAKAVRVFRGKFGNVTVSIPAAKDGE